MKVIIKEFMGQVSFQVIDSSGDRMKLSKETLEDILSYLNETGLLYSDILGKDKIPTILFDK